MGAIFPPKLGYFCDPIKTDWKQEKQMIEKSFDVWEKVTII